MNVPEDKRFETADERRRFYSRREPQVHYEPKLTITKRITATVEELHRFYFKYPAWT